MVGTLAVAVSVAVGAVLLGLGLVLSDRFGGRTRERPRRDLERALEARLAERLGPGPRTHLQRAPTVRRIAVVDRGATEAKDAGADERPVSVPVVSVDLGTTDAPGPKLVFEYVAGVLEAVHPVLAERGERVRCYDVEFAFGPDGLLVSGECRRVSVTPELADRLCEDDGYGAFDLRRDVERTDEDDGPTTAWGACGRSDFR